MNLTSQEPLPMFVQLNGKNYFGSINPKTRVFTGVDQGQETFYRYLKAGLLGEQMHINYDANTTVMTKPLTMDEEQQFRQMEATLARAKAQWQARMIIQTFDHLLGK